MLIVINNHHYLSIDPTSYEYLRTPATELVDGGRELVMKQRGFQLINPTEKWFPGITELRNNFESWDWRFGKTPAFTVERKVKGAMAGHSNGGEAGKMDVGSGSGGSVGSGSEIKLKLDVELGLIKNISLVMDNSETIPVVSSYTGQAYDEDTLHAICESLKGISAEMASKAMNGSL